MATKIKKANPKTKTSTCSKTTRIRGNAATTTTSKRVSQLAKGMAGSLPKPKPVAKPAGGMKMGGGKPVGGKRGG